jgi:cephalosporin hydroxylase
VAAKVTALASSSPAALVLLGLRDAAKVIATFERYAPMVPVGGYVIVENTVVKGRAVDLATGRGAYEAVEAILSRRGDFVSDPAGERYMLTFNRGGYLKRIADARA